MESLSENYGWLPSEIQAEDPVDILAYLNILGGKAKTMKKGKPKGGNPAKGFPSISLSKTAKKFMKKM